MLFLIVSIFYNPTGLSPRIAVHISVTYIYLSGNQRNSILILTILVKWEHTVDTLIGSLYFPAGRIGLELTMEVFNF